MIRNIFKILPFFIVEWMGKKFGEKTKIMGRNAYIVFENTYIIEK
jgi:hypothetical protein